MTIDDLRAATTTCRRCHATVRTTETLLIEVPQRHGGVPRRVHACVQCVPREAKTVRDAFARSQAMRMQRP